MNTTAKIMTLAVAMFSLPACDVEPVPAPVERAGKLAAEPANDCGDADLTDITEIVAARTAELQCLADCSETWLVCLEDAVPYACLQCEFDHASCRSACS